MPGVAYIYTKDGHLVDWNKKAQELTEYTEEELYNKSILDFTYEPDREKLVAAVKDVFELGYAQVEQRLISKSGKIIPLLGNGSPVMIDGEEYLIGLGIEISELWSAREKIKDQMKEISRLNELLNAENIYLRDQIKLTGPQHKMVGESESLKYIFYKINQVAPTDASVLIQGETGTGKELVARAVHKESQRSNKPFITVNCASIPENLIESELFGHEKGAFTSAVEQSIGRFELANGGTIFLDEIGELPMCIQPKLLRILQQGEFERIGSSKTHKTDVRVISATNKVLEDEISKGHFRNDLYYRINVFPISVNPLRERKEDIPLLVEYFTKYYSEKYNKPIRIIPPKCLQELINFTWPGNIRELENVIERAVITSQKNTLTIESFPETRIDSNEYISLEDLEKNHITGTLEKTSWKISGNGGAASILKLNPETLRSKMRKLGIKRQLSE